MDRLPEPAVPPSERSLAAATPARVFLGSAGTSLPSRAQLALRADHAFARDAAQEEFDLARDWDPEFVATFRLFEVSTEAASRKEFLARPERGREFSEETRALIAAACPRAADLQIVAADGLSATALRRQGPRLLAALSSAAAARTWSVGRPFVVRHGRVGILNEVGGILAPRVAVLLIGERPGLSTAESLSAYMAFRPRPGHTDAERNLVSNIHPRGVDPETAVRRILALAESMVRENRSGTAIKEGIPSLGS